MIELVNVSKNLGGKKVLDKVNLKIGHKEVIGVLGSNGTGKSVLLKTIAGFLKPDKGKVFVSGEVGISIQDNSFYESLTVKQNLDYFSKIYKIKHRKKKVEELIRELDLKKFINSNANTLSGGTKKKLDLACSLLNNPTTLILDEPFTGLDKFFVNDLTSMLKILNSIGITLVISSHIIQHISDLCNRFIIIQDGIVREISKEKIKEFF